jgi:hypothetical protein
MLQATLLLALTSHDESLSSDDVQQIRFDA